MLYLGVSWLHYVCISLDSRSYIKHYFNNELSDYLRKNKSVFGVRFLTEGFHSRMNINGYIDLEKPYLNVPNETRTLNLFMI